jgi:glycosyltransferase involved in cell wall biosynthesis
MVKISVIMPVYNGEDFLERSCKNLSKQTLDNFELICVDDGSSDNSLEELKKLSNKYDFIKIFSQDNQGSGKARNYGISKAQGEYIAFLDADDVFIDKDALEKMYNAGMDYDADMVAGNLLRVDNHGKLLKNFNYVDDNYAYCSKIEKIRPEEYGIPWAFYKNIYRRDFLDRYDIHFPDLKRGQDPVFLANILTKIDYIVTVPVNLYGYSFEAAGGPDKRINNYEKKYDYMMHYYQCFKILDGDGKFNDSLIKYAESLFIFLSLEDNIHDKDLFKAVHEVFEKDNPELFNNHLEEIVYLRLSLADMYDFYSYENSIDNIEESLINSSLNGSIPDKILDKYSEFVKNNSKEGDMVCVSKSLINKAIPNLVNERTGKLEELLSSNSWKMTAPIRKFKNRVKKQ